MNRCANICSCRKLINVRGMHIRVGDKLFCSSSCYTEYIGGKSESDTERISRHPIGNDFVPDGKQECWMF